MHRTLSELEIRMLETREARNREMAHLTPDLDAIEQMNTVLNAMHASVAWLYPTQWGQHG